MEKSKHKSNDGSDETCDGDLDGADERSVVVDLKTSTADEADKNAEKLTLVTEKDTKSLVTENGSSVSEVSDKSNGLDEVVSADVVDESIQEQSENEIGISRKQANKSRPGSSADSETSNADSEKFIELDSGLLEADVINEQVCPSPEARTVRPKCQVNLGPSDTTNCCVPNCSLKSQNEKNQSTYITFPKDPSRFTEWARAINRPDLLAFMNKKETANLLVCSKHFPKNMWINSNTRLKKLHKNAVPELDTSNNVEDNEDDEEDEDDDEIVVLPPENKTPKPSRKGGGLKVRKVSSLLSESALRDTLSSPTTILPDISPRKQVTKWPSILQRKQAMASTDMEKKLLTENTQLKCELDKNMDYILNQKSHYDALLAKEKEKCTTLSNKITQLENEQKKMQKSYEAQINAQKKTFNNKDVGQKDMFDKLKKAQALNVESESKIRDLHETIASMRSTNDSLTLKVNEMAETSPPPPPENLLQGENFKAFLSSYLRSYKHMKSQVEDLTLRLEDQETDSGQKALLLRLAAQYLNHGQFAWLQAQLSDTPITEQEYSDHFREFCIAFYEVSQFAYKVCRKVFGLAPMEYVEKWLKDPKSDISNVNSTINALFEECQPALRGATLITNVLYEKELTDLVDINGKPLINIRKSRQDKHISKKRKCMIDSESEDDKDDDYDEGKLSEDEDELFYTSESDNESVDEKSNGKSELAYSQKRTDTLLPPPQTPSTSAGPSHSTHPDFDFMMDDSSQNTSMQIGNSMPILVPDSPIVPLTHISGHGRKKIADTVGGNKNIFRIVNS